MLFQSKEDLAQVGERVVEGAVAVRDGDGADENLGRRQGEEAAGGNVSEPKWSIYVVRCCLQRNHVVHARIRVAVEKGGQLRCGSIVEQTKAYMMQGGGWSNMSADE